SELCGAVHTEVIGGIGIEPALGDAFAALGAIAELTVLHARQGPAQPRDLSRPAAAGGACHGLALDGIEARQATHALLVERDRRTILRSAFDQGFELGELAFDSRPIFLDEPLVL